MALDRAQLERWLRFQRMEEAIPLFAHGPIDEATLLANLPFRWILPGPFFLIPALMGTAVGGITTMLFCGLALRHPRPENLAILAVALGVLLAAIGWAFVPTLLVATRVTKQWVVLGSMRMERTGRVTDFYIGRTGPLMAGPNTDTSKVLGDPETLREMLACPGVAVLARGVSPMLVLFVPEGWVTRDGSQRSTV